MPNTTSTFTPFFTFFSIFIPVSSFIFLATPFHPYYRKLRIDPDISFWIDIYKIFMYILLHNVSRPAWAFKAECVAETVHLQAPMYSYIREGSPFFFFYHSGTSHHDIHFSFRCSLNCSFVPFSAHPGSTLLPWDLPLKVGPFLFLR